jgi:monoterpene epsilon-lactone hydrolase
MAMGNRPEVETASAPIVAVDVGALAQQLVAALARVPFRHPFSGSSSLASNLGVSVTREVIRSLMGYSVALPIPEFRSLELVLDEICSVIMPPFVRSLRVDSHQTEFGGVPGILYVPRDVSPVGMILYLHGGGYIGTSPEMYSFFTARLCRETQCATFVADYRLAPEFPYPAGAEDASAVFEALKALGTPPERLLLAGDSGGGGLANTLVLAPPEEFEPVRPAGLILFSPEVDLRLDAPSVTENAAKDILPWNIPTTSYLHGVDAASPLVDAVEADLSAFPPTFVSWGEDEMFRDPIRRFVQRLRESDVPTEAQEHEGMFHVFPILMPWADASRQVFRAVGEFVHKLVAGAEPLPMDRLKRG